MNYDGVYRKDYQAEKTKLFIQVSEKLGRGASPPTATEIVRRANKNATVYFVARMWRCFCSEKYFPLLFIALVTIFLSGAAPAIYDGLEECQKSWWVVLGTVAAIICDIVVAAAIECIIIFNANTAREVLCQSIPTPDGDCEVRWEGFQGRGGNQCAGGGGGGSTLETNIFRFLLNWSGNAILELDPGSLQQWTLLLELLVTRATAISIWRALMAILSHSAVFSLIVVPDPVAAPSPPTLSTRQATPVSSNSNCIFEGSETHQIMDQRPRHELDRLLFPNTPGFLDAYFPLSSSVVGQVLALSKPAHLSDTRWVNWPRLATENLVREWFETCMMRCWIFHRSGALGSEQFSINAKPERFLSVVVGYATMSPAELGYDPTITAGGDTGWQVTLYDLGTSPFVVTAAIATRGTTCSEAKLPGETEFNYVCKDAWRSYSYISEGILLREAQTAGVEGLVEYIGHVDLYVGAALDDIFGNVMKGLDLTGVKALNLRPPEGQSTAPSTPLELEPHSLGPVRRASNSAQEARKRPYPGSLPLNGSSQKRRMTSMTVSVTPTSVNRVHTRLITTKGRSITKFRSNRELLLALHDAIKGHRSLFRHGILHRDISVNNVMITLGHRIDGFQGFLIDLDLAHRMDDNTDTTTHHRTGTMEFMAIGALSAESHTYRHDLESFFYVFLWLCIHYHPDGTGQMISPTPAVLKSWSKLSFQDAAAKKRGDMDPGGFEILVEYFTKTAQELVPLAWQIREVLFPWRNRLFTRTDPEAEPVYERMLNAIAEAAEEIEGRV
ncbi:hypothetical protein Q9L58_010124 [Maublancomyces gigas]|uniref:EKC/KEOPS complex subunit BUD32 n=1 Tax=Discina gigas TaxID=1032678 RepID=A0ABR3G4Z2_9PEZI